jgi:hypothetical protein
LFYVLEGIVGIKTSGGTVTLHGGQPEYRVAPGEMHEFQVYEDGIMVEVMYVEYDDDDIERETLGGELDGSSKDFSKLMMKLKEKGEI